jgi:hypothetical protein
MAGTLASFNLPDVPTVAEYKKALLACRPALRSKGGFSMPMEMLKENYYAPQHTVTAGELALKVRLANFNAANLTYGLFAKALCKEIHRMPQFQIAILVTFSGGQPGDEFVQWTMLPQVATALEELRWVKRQSPLA